MNRLPSHGVAPLEATFAQIQLHAAGFARANTMYAKQRRGIGEVTLAMPNGLHVSSLEEIPYWTLQQHRFGESAPYTVDCEHYQDPGKFDKLVMYEVHRSHIPSDQARREIQDRGQAEPNEIVLTMFGLARAIHHDHVRFKTGDKDPVEIQLQPPVASITNPAMSPEDLWLEYHESIAQLQSTPRYSSLRRLIGF